MKHDLEAELEEIVRAASEDAAIKEWAEAQTRSKEALYNYRFDHVKHVVEVSRIIAKDVGADEEVVIIAAWLHDIAKPGMGSTKKHGEEGAKKAKAILLKKSLSPPVIDRVCDAIRKHVGLTLEEPIQPLEAQVLWDADKIAKLGAIGVIHYLVNGIKINPGFLLDEVSNHLSGFLDLAERIVKSMNTELGRRMAAKRFETLKYVANELEAELTLTDIPE